MKDWCKRLRVGVMKKIYRLLISFTSIKFYPTLLKPLSEDFKIVRMPTDTGSEIVVKFHKVYISYCSYWFNKMSHGQQCLYLAVAELPDGFSSEMYEKSGFSMIVYDFTFFKNDEETLVKILLDAYLDHLFHEADSIKK